MNGESSWKSTRRTLAFLMECRKRTMFSGENLLAFLLTKFNRPIIFSGSCYLVLICRSASALMRRLMRLVGVNAKYRSLWSLSRADTFISAFIMRFICCSYLLLEPCLSIVFFSVLKLTYYCDSRSLFFNSSERGNLLPLIYSSSCTLAILFFLRSILMTLW
jgi:hypothetical protein